MRVVGQVAAVASIRTYDVNIADAALGHEGDVPTIRRPSGKRGPSRVVRQTAGVTPIRIYHVNLSPAVALEPEGDVSDHLETKTEEL